MKKFITSIILAFLGLIVFNSCEKNKETPLELPPYESMAIDFSKFTTGQKSTDFISTDTTKLNFGVAGLTVLFWNATLTVTLAVPVTAFYASFQSEPEFLGEGTWQWQYDVPGFANTYKARLTGKMQAESVKWEMYISRIGIAAHEEFLWFEGTSDFDGNGGQWILYHSYDVQEAVLQIDWERLNDEIGNIKYTYIRESNNGDLKQLTAGSYLEYGLQDGVLNAFYSIQYNQRDRNSVELLNVDIEWSLSEFNGRIKAPHYYLGNTSWHCWDSQGYDIACE